MLESEQANLNYLRLEANLVESRETAEDGATTPRCFILCPIGDQDAEIGSEARETWENTVELFEEVIRPACAAFGLEPIRADRIARTGEIPEQICRHLRDDDVVIADLTGANPNVMYELGLRHTMEKLTIQLGESEKLPFDVAAIRTIKFQRTERGLVQARKRLSKALSVGLSSGGDLVTATRVWLDKPVRPVASSDDGDSDEPGFLEKMADMEEHLDQLPGSMTVVTEIMDAMHEATTEIRERVDKANTSGAPASARLVLADKLAERLTPHAARLEAVAVDYELAVEKVDPGVRHLLNISPQDSEEEKALREFRGSVGTAHASVRDYIASSKQLRDQLKKAGEISRSLRRVNGRTRTALTRLIGSSEQVLLWGDLLDESS